MGACFQCSHGRCIRAYHGSCGVFDGVRYDKKKGELYCKYHAKRDKGLDYGRGLKEGMFVQFSMMGKYYFGKVTENNPGELSCFVSVFPGVPGGEEEDILEVRYESLLLDRDSIFMDRELFSNQVEGNERGDEEKESVPVMKRRNSRIVNQR